MKKQFFGNDTWFGYHYPETTHAAWGARLIHNSRSHTLECLWDRHCYYGTEQSVEDLQFMLKCMQLFDIIMARLQHLSRMYILRGDQDTELIVYENYFLKVLANTNASGGYVYISCFWKDVNTTKLVQDGDQDAIGVEGDPFGHDTRVHSTGALVWSHEHLPQIGDMVTLSIWPGTHRVMGYASQNGYLFGLAVPEKIVKIEERMDRVAKAKWKWLQKGDNAHGWKKKMKQSRDMSLRFGSDIPEFVMQTHGFDGRLYSDIFHSLQDETHFPSMTMRNFMGREWSPYEAVLASK